jgi:hypothetical protein
MTDPADMDLANLPEARVAVAPRRDTRRILAANLETRAAGLMIGWLGKLPGLAQRLSLVQEYLAWAASPDDWAEPRDLGQHAMTAAIVFLESFAVPMARRTFGAAALPEVERDAARLARWLAARRPLPEG